MNGIRTKKTGTWNVKFSAYCGMTYDLDTECDRERVKEVVRAFLKTARKSGKPVTKIGKGTWEVESPEDAVMVGDNEGVLKIVPNVERYRVILGRKVRIG